MAKKVVKKKKSLLGLRKPLKKPVKKQSKKTTVKRKTVSKKPKQQKQLVEIKPVNSYMKIRKNAFLIEHKDKTYTTSKNLVEQLITGKLYNKKRQPQYSINLGVFGDDGKIQNGTDVWLTLKKKSLYAMIDNELLITSVSSVEKLFSEDWDNVKLGRIQKI